MIRNTIREYYLLTAIRSAATGVFAATYATFLLQKGLNLFEVNLVNFIFFATLFLCEIPTGAFADVFGRKASFISSCALLAIGMGIYAISDTFWEFAVSEIISAVGITFSTGAFKAWFVDKLKHHGHEGTLSPIFARASQVKQASGIAAAFIGAFSADISPAYPWIIGAILFGVSGILAAFLQEEYFVRQEFSWKSGLEAMRQTVRSSIRYGISNSNVRFVLIIMIVQVFAVQAPNMQWQPFFGEHLASKSSLGFVWTGNALSLMLGAWIAPKILRRIMDERMALAICQIVIGAGLMLAVLSGFAVGLLMFFIHEVARGACEPIKDAYLHDHIPPKERATIDSFDSLAHHGGGMIGLLFSGFVALKAGIPATWVASGAILIASTVLIMRNGKRSLLS